MSDTTKIQWANHTGGPWLICSEVSPGCAHCYARQLMESRLGHTIRKAYRLAGLKDWETRPVWGDKAPRVVTKGFWDDARRFNRSAANGNRPRMFPSMIDWLDEMPAGIIDQGGKPLNPVSVLVDFLKLIHDTPNLDWLLLTKRPENFSSRIMEALHLFAATAEKNESNVSFVFWLQHWVSGDAPHNVWFGVSAENQAMADKRVPELLKIPARVRFISAEPLLGPIDFRKWIGTEIEGTDFLDWIIFGGESGPGSRVCNVDDIRDGVKQCQAAGVAAFVKQVGSNPVSGELNLPIGKSNGDSVVVSSRLIHDKKGGDMAEWPEDLRVRQFPELTGMANSR